MFLPLHITIALASMLSAAYLYFYPKNSTLRITYALVAATFGTGFGLIFAGPTNMTQICITGLVYLGFISIGIVSARNTLTRTNPPKNL